MKIVDIRTLAGPNVHLHRPVLVMRLALEDLTERESYEVPGFVDRLVSLLPGVAEHGCDTGAPGRFLERLRMGTYYGHTTEHVALELMTLAGYEVGFGRTRFAGEPGLYNVVVEYRDEHVARYLLRTAVELVDFLAHPGRNRPAEPVTGARTGLAGRPGHVPQPFDLDSWLENRLAEARHIAAQMELGPSTRAIVEAAEQRGIPWRRLDDQSLIQLGYGRYRKHILAATGDATRAIAVEIVGNKDLTKQLLQAAAIPVPQGRTVRTADEALSALRDFGGPVVVKPLDGQQGKGVSLNLSVPEQILLAYDEAVRYGEQVLIEEYVAGRDYRVLVIGGRMVAASERVPAHVVGDGQHTVTQLVELANLDPRRGEDHEKPLTRLKIDTISLGSLGRQGLTPQSVPEPGQVVWLRASANLSTGGTATDVTDLVHPANARLCERAARIVGLDVCGVDLVVPDIGQPVRPGYGAIVELNAAPGLRMHLFPSAGQRREVGRAVVDLLYPPGAQSRIPIVSVTGTNGKTTVVRMIDHVLRMAGQAVGLTTTDGIWVDGQPIAQGDMTGPWSARAVLADPAVEVAVLETARGGLVRGGLAYDWSDIGIITNVQRDHIGQDGITSVEDLVHIKSLVAERVRLGGTLILNADDEQAAGIAARPRVRDLPRQIIYFSLRSDHALVRQHTSAGGTAYFVRDDWIIEARGAGERKLVALREVPATLGGAAPFHAANALAAAAACRALRLTPAVVAQGLATFDHNQANPGRTNLYRVGEGYLLLDYGHNPHALASVGMLTANHRALGARVTGIVGLPGDRVDAIAVEAGQTVAQVFDRVIVREDHDLRGRQPGEVPALLCKAIHQAAPDISCQVIPDEAEALSAALASLTPRELVVLFCEKTDGLAALLERHQAQPVAGLEYPGGYSLPLSGAARSVPLGT